MFPLALMALAGFAGYQYAKSKNKNSNNNQTVTDTVDKDESAEQNKVQNYYNYYTNDSTDGNTLFNGQTQKKRTLFGNKI